MITFADSSALAKAVWDEEGSDVVTAMLGKTRQLAVSELTYVELRAALAAALRHGRLPSTARESSVAAIEGLIAGAKVMRITSNLLREAAAAAEAQRLRALDAIQFATLARLDRDAVQFACWDLELRRAALGLGYALLPEEMAAG